MKRFEYRTCQQRFDIYDFYSAIVEFDFQNEISYYLDLKNVKNSVVHNLLQRWNLFQLFMSTSQIPILTQLILIFFGPFSDEGECSDW